MQKFVVIQIESFYASKWMNGISGLRLIAMSFILICVTGMIHPLSAQIIDNRSGNVFKEEMFFNQQFLWLNKVKTITGVLSIKRPNRPIEQRPDVTVYRFNEVGLLHELDKVSSVSNLVDSLTIQYKRNDLGEVELKRENGTQGYFVTHLNYDEHGRLIRLDFGRAENLSGVRGKLEPGQEIAINSESYTWNDPQSGVIRKSVFNNYGLHYANWMITKNEAGLIESEVEELVMSGRTTTRKYFYNERVWIDKITTSDNMSGTEKTESFIYDPLGNLLKVEFREGTVLMREVEILYTQTMLIEAFLDHDILSHDIRITKFSYEFYK